MTTVLSTQPGGLSAPASHALEIKTTSRRGAITHEPIRFDHLPSAEEVKEMERAAKEYHYGAKLQRPDKVDSRIRSLLAR